MRELVFISELSADMIEANGLGLRDPDELLRCGVNEDGNIWIEDCRIVTYSAKKLIKNTQNNE
tara:strand:+ start:11513 stop:11701 length:189 start_codon:yes stop_codon:yes gene_type:complete